MACFWQGRQCVNHAWLQYTVAGGNREHSGLRSWQYFQSVDLPVLLRQSKLQVSRLLIMRIQPDLFRFFLLWLLERQELSRMEENAIIWTFYVQVSDVTVSRMLGGRLSLGYDPYM